MRHLMALTLLTLGLALLAVPAQADTITYTLRNNPDGNQAPPEYGLRIDGLTDADSSREWLFDFEAAGSNMRLDWDTVTNDIHIYGTTFGGEQDGSGYVAGSTALWAVDFSYSGSNAVSPGGSVDGVRFNGSPTVMGSITNNTTNDEYLLTDWPNSGNSFNFTDETYKNYTPTGGELNGWGWLGLVTGIDGAGAPTSYYHTTSQDWLFIGTPVPEPTSMALFALGAGGLAIVRRRRKQSAA